MADAYIQENSISTPSSRSPYSRLVISNKLKRRGVADRIQAGRFSEIGNNLRRLGYPARADVLLRTAVAAQPLSGKVWARLVTNRLVWHLRTLRNATRR